jgi:SAM-dependent methyltransferase
MHRLAPTLPDAELGSPFYESEAGAYVDATIKVDMGSRYSRFLAHVPAGGAVLDAGSGSGRDTLHFLRRGYRVEAFDSSPTLCARSTALTGIETQLLRFQEFEGADQYDGIWACASLLHVPRHELEDCTARLVRALKPGGAVYMSFKLGSGERLLSDGRLFTDMDETGIRALFGHLKEARLVDVWVSHGEGHLMGRADWLNAIAVKGEAENPA